MPQYNQSGVKKVGMFLDKDFPPDPRVENEAITLISAGYEVHLFTLSYEQRLPKMEIINGVNVYRYPAGKFAYKLSALVYTVPFFQWIITPALRRFINEIEPAVLHIHDMVIAEAVMKVNNKRLPVVLDLHENRPAIMKLYKHTNVFPGKYLISLNKWNKKQSELIKKASRVVVVTQEAADQYRQQTGEPLDKFVHVPNTVRRDLFLNQEIRSSIVKKFESHFRVLYVGDTGIRRGTLTAIDSLVFLKQKIPTIMLILVGSSSADLQLKKRAKELDVEDYVSFEGWQDLKLFPSYIKGSEVCISPLLRNLHHDTTFANKIFQYMAMGKPQVVSDCPPQARIIHDNGIGLVHEANNAEQMADCIIQLYNDEKLRDDMGKMAEELVSQKWNWNLTGQNLLAIYNELLL